MSLFTPNIDKLEKSKDVSKLCAIAVKSFNQADTDTCYKAVDALQRLADPRANEILLAILEKAILLPAKKYTPDNIRCTALDAISKTGDKRAVEPLAKILWESGNPGEFGYLTRIVYAVDADAEEPLLTILRHHLNFNLEILVNPPNDNTFILHIIFLLVYVGGNPSLDVMSKLSHFSAFPKIVQASITAIDLIKKKKK